MSSSELLLVCADQHESRPLTFALEQAGLLVNSIPSSESNCKTLQPDLTLLISQNSHYLSTIHALRARFKAPLLLLTDYGHETDLVNALKEGVDFIFFRPYSIRFLVAQILALQRHLMPSNLGSTAQLVFSDIRLDPETQILYVRNDPPRHLSQLEFRLLYMLMRHPRQTIPLGMLVEYVWGYNGDQDGELVRKLVWRLRAKLNDNGREPRFIHTIPNVGYCFRDAGECYSYIPHNETDTGKIETQLRQVLRCG